MALTGVTNAEKAWTVYVHISPSGKYYVGITSQKNINGRWRNGEGYIHNTHFYRAIKKYGWGNFQHEIIAGNLHEDEAKNFEKLLIQKLKSTDKNHGYNISLGGDGTPGVSHYGVENSFYGRKHSEESRKKMRESRPSYVGKNNPFYNKRHSEETVKKISTARKRQFDNGYVWICRELTDEDRKKISEKHSKPIIRYGLDMAEIKRYSSVMEAVREGFRAASIRDSCSGKKPIYKESIWRYANPDDLADSSLRYYDGKILCFDKTRSLIGSYRSFSEASRSTGIDRKHISRACHSECHYYLGKYWLLATDCDSFLSQSAS